MTIQKHSVSSKEIKEVKINEMLLLLNDCQVAKTCSLKLT